MRSSQASRRFRIFGSETRNSSQYSVGKSQVFFRYNNVLVLVHLLAFIRTELKSNDKLQNVHCIYKTPKFILTPPPPPPWTLMSSIGSVDLRVDNENILIHFLPPPPPPPLAPLPFPSSPFLILPLPHLGPFPFFVSFPDFFFSPSSSFLTGLKSV